MQYKEGQRLQGSDGNIYVVQGGVPRHVNGGNGGPRVVVPQPQKPEPPKFIPGAPGYVLGPGNTAEPIVGMPPAKTTYRILTQQEKLAQGLDPAGDYQVSSDGQITSIASPRNQQNQLTATERGKAVQAYTDAAALERVADNLERQFNETIGKTKGIAGLKDTLPLPDNRRFNDTSFQARGLVKRAMGFTGGEGNTIGEIQLNYGPYLPEAGEYDDRIVGKIQALRNLAKDARTRSVAMLGGTPDANGRVTPVGQQSRDDDSDEAPAYIGGDGAPTIEAGQHRDPGLAGAEGQYRQMLAQGRAPGEILQMLRSKGIEANPQDVVAQARWLKANPGKINQLDTSQIEMVWRDKVTRNTFGINPDSGAGAYGIAAANALTGGTLDELAGGEAQQAKEILRQRNPGASLLGDISGAAIGMTGLNAGLRAGGGGLSALATRGGGIGGDMLYGAAYGAGESNDDRLTGAVYGAGGAGAGNLVGRGLVSGIGRSVRGAASPHLQRLNDLGVPLTPGQIAGQGGAIGRGVRAVEDTLESVPFLGSAIKSRKAEGLEAFNRAAFKDALSPINRQIEGDIGQEAIGQAQDLVGEAYGDALGGVSLRPDGAFVRQTDDILRRGSAVPIMGEQFNYLMGQQLDPLFTPNLDGRGFQSALQTLSKAGSDFPKQGIMGAEVAGPTREMREAFIEMANRQAPGAMPALNAANAANKNVSILGDAVTQSVNNSAESGMFTPAQLARKAVDNTKKFGGKKAAARGNVPFRDLTEAGQAVLPNVIPNSGTTDRALATIALPTVLGGSAVGSEAMGLDPSVTAALAGLAALSTKKGNNLIQSMALKRSPAARSIGEEILLRRRLGGMFGAGGATPLLVGH